MYNKWITTQLNFTTLRPSKSPDATPLDFFLWGYLKSKVYRGNAETLAKLKAAITEEVRNSQPSTAERGMSGTLGPIMPMFTRVGPPR